MNRKIIPVPPVERFRFVVQETPLGPHTRVFKNDVELTNVHGATVTRDGLGACRVVTLTFLADSVEVDAGSMVCIEG